MTKAVYRYSKNCIFSFCERNSYETEKIGFGLTFPPSIKLLSRAEGDMVPNGRTTQNRVHGNFLY